MTQTLGFLTMRAQGFHAGHRDLIRKARKQCDKLLILLGSVNLPQTISNPFTYEQRKDEIRRFITHEYSFTEGFGFEILPVNTYVYSDSQWIADVTELVNEKAETGNFDQIRMFGHNKPGNTYLNWFPNFKYIEIDSSVPDVHATDLRAHWFKHDRHVFSDDVLADYDYFAKEKETFKDYPYPETLNFMCGDAVIECAGHVALIRRIRAPGRNNWALPGGFKERNETSFECVIRELMEEVNLRVPEKVLRGSVVSSKLYDSPHRGEGIPRSTFAVHFRISLNSDGTLPRISPADDALQAEWFTISDALNRMSMHDDHSAIISELCGVMPIPAHKNPRFA
jgi:bifunctional NMN adenylyltransferase/nudix hydrolase